MTQFKKVGAYYNIMNQLYKVITNNQVYSLALINHPILKEVKLH